MQRVLASSTLVCRDRVSAGAAILMENMVLCLESVVWRDPSTARAKTLSTVVVMSRHGGGGGGGSPSKFSDLLSSASDEVRAERVPRPPNQSKTKKMTPPGAAKRGGGGGGGGLLKQYEKQLSFLREMGFAVDSGWSRGKNGFRTEFCDRPFPATETTCLLFGA